RVDSVVGASRQGLLPAFGCAGAGNDAAGAQNLGELNCVVANAPGAAGNEDGFAGLEPSSFLEHLKSSDAGNNKRGSDVKIEAWAQFDDIVDAGEGVLGVAAKTVSAEKREHPVTGMQRCDTLANGVYDTGGFAAEDRRQRCRQWIGITAPTHNVGVIDARGF